MPAFGLSDSESEAITAFLLKSARPRNNRNEVKENNKEKGRRLVVSLGCLACHQLDGIGNDGLFGGGDLTEIASKRPAAFFDQWLASPSKLNPQHQMPVFDLSSSERASSHSISLRWEFPRRKRAPTDLHLAKNSSPKVKNYLPLIVVALAIRPRNTKGSHCRNAGLGKIMFRPAQCRT